MAFCWCFDCQADGKGIGLRFPRFLRIRDDKTAEALGISEGVGSFATNEEIDRLEVSK